MGLLRHLLGGAWLRSLLGRRRLMVVTACCAATGLFLSGVATGWWAADQLSPRTGPDVVVVAATGGDVEADGTILRRSCQTCAG